MTCLTKLSRLSRYILALAFSMLSLTALPAVAQESTPSVDTTTACTDLLGIGADGNACISVVHASPDAPNVDLYVNGELALSNLGFGWWSNWIALPEGEYQVQVAPTGESVDMAVIDATVNLEAGQAYQIAATGFVEEIAPQVLTVDLAEISEGTARVQVVHTVPDAPAVDIALTDGDVLISSLEFPMASEFLDVPAGVYDLEVRIAGTEDVVLALPEAELTANTFYHVYAIGSAESNTVAPFVIATELLDQPSSTPVADACAVILGIGTDTDTCVNVIHASPDAPNVDIWVNGEPALTDVAYQDFSGWLALPAGEYHIVVTPTGESAESAVIDTTLTLEAGTAYHIAAVGFVADLAPAVIEADLSATDAGNARVRVIHASPDAPEVDIALIDGDVLVSNLAFAGASEYLEVPAGTYDLEVRVAGTMDVALPLPGITLDENTLYDVIAVGTAAEGTLTVIVIPSMTSHAE